MNLMSSFPIDESCASCWRELPCLLAQGCGLSFSWSFDPSGGRIVAQGAVRSSLSSLRCDSFFSDSANFLTPVFRFFLSPGRGELARSLGRIRFHGSGKGSPSLEESVGRLKAAWARARRATLLAVVTSLRLKFLSMIAKVRAEEWIINRRVTARIISSMEVTPDI